MMLNITESTLNDALKHFDIEKLPTVWNGHFEFQDCIIKVQKNSATVYMSGRFDKSRPVKCRATIDHSKGVGGQVVKYLEIYPVIKDANVEPLKQDDEIIKLNDEDKTPKFPFILPEIKT
ncbi:MAG: hypothetical protein FWC41_12210, partial [Firmicutes bacterium]|nr:hypothetical protein [Bacillota bacterium]